MLVAIPYFLWQFLNRQIYCSAKYTYCDKNSYRSRSIKRICSAVRPIAAIIVAVINLCFYETWLDLLFQNGTAWKYLRYISKLLTFFPISRIVSSFQTLTLSIYIYGCVCLILSNEEARSWKSRESRVVWREHFSIWSRTVQKECFIDVVSSPFEAMPLHLSFGANGY